MKLQLSALIATATIVWWKVKSFWAFWGPVVEQIVQEIENRAKDGLIDKADRKAIALKAIDLVAQKKGKKIDILTKWGISWLIDRYAGKLIPHDIVIPDVVNIVTDKEKK